MTKQTEAMKRWVEVFEGNWHDELVDSEWADRAHQAIAEMRQAIAEQPAQQSAERGEPVAWTDEQLQMLNFLYGAGDFDGVWFDQKHPTENGAFWWRKHLRRLFTSPPASKPWVSLTDEHCTWKQQDDIHMPDTWEADCGAMWTFTEGGPKDNNMHYCPNCGKPAIEAAHGITRSKT